MWSYVQVALVVIIRALHSPSLRTLPGDLSAGIRDGIRPKRMAWRSSVLFLQGPLAANDEYHVSVSTEVPILR